MRLLRRIPALLLAVTLALATGLMPASTLLLAAPAAQGSDATVFGYFESEIIPGEGDSPDLVIGLLLYEDGSAEVISDYQTDENVITEVGTWVDNADGTLTLTVTGTTDGDYAAPVTLDFEITADGSLFSNAFGADGLTLLPATLPATLPDTAGTTPVASNSEIILAQIPVNALVYQSDILPAASTPGLQLTLAIFDDSSLTLISDYVNPGEIVVEVGTWSEDVDGSLVVNLLGQIENGTGTLNEYEDSLEFIFTPNEDGSLSLVDEGGALFGDEGLTLFPATATGEAIETSGTATAGEAVAAEEAVEEEATPEATETPAATATPESTTVTETAVITPEATITPSATVTATEVVTTGETLTETEAVTNVGVFTPSGAYISEVLPSTTGNGTFLVTIFYGNGTLLFTTYSLDGDLPVVEIGTWLDNLDGTYTITATGTVEELYEEPVIVNFTFNEQGAIVISNVTLYPLADVDFTGEAATIAPTLVATFQSELITDTIDFTHTLTLDVYDDFSAELITEYPESGDVTIQYGEWALDEADDSFTLTLIGDEIADYDEPIVWVFEANVDDTLVLLNDEDEYYGEDGLTLFGVAAPTTATPAEEATDDVANAAALEGAQFFQSEVLPAASSPGMQLTLGLLDDGSAALDYDYLNGQAVVTNLGEWVDNADGSILLTLTEGPNGALPLPIELTLELDDDGNLVIVDATEESLGLLDVALAPVVLE